MPESWSSILKAPKTSITQEFIDFVRTMMQKYMVSGYYVTMACLKVISTRQEFSLTEEKPEQPNFKPPSLCGRGYRSSFD